MTFHDRAIVLQPGEGYDFSLFGDRHTTKATGDLTEGKLGLVEIQMQAPAAGPPVHIHHGHDEAFYVLAGELTVRIGERTITAPAGSFVFVPTGTAHGFANRGPDEARLLVFSLPAGLERALEEVSEIAPNADGPLDMDGLQANAKKYRVEIVGPPLS
jgi:quercetin dioxygenase-like cupin family protein